VIVGLEEKCAMLLRELKATSQEAYIISGVYFLFSGEELMYIGQSKNVHARVASHIGRADFSFDRYSYIHTPPSALDEWESFYIHALQPPKNKGDYNHGRRFKKAPRTPEQLVQKWMRDLVAGGRA